MGRIRTSITIQNMQSPDQGVKSQIFVDTAAAYLTLPSHWKSQLGSLRKLRTVRTQFADQRHSSAEIFGPVLVKIDGFEEIVTEVLFLDMAPDENGEYEPLLGYIPLEQINVAVDMQNHRLVRLKYVDVKKAA